MPKLPFTLDPSTLCPHCNHYPLRRPLVWNATSKRSGQPICAWCADVELELSLLALVSGQEVADA